MLEVKDLSVRYGSVEALRDVSIKVETGGLVAILGANGSGKSTLLRTISGIVKAGAGDVVLDGTVITGLRPEEIVRRGIAHVPEGRGILPDFTVRENLMIGAYVRRGQDVSHDYRRVMARFDLRQHQEFIAPIAADGVGLADAALKPLGHHLQNQVACMVAMAIVDIFEAIEVDEQDGQSGAISFCTGCGLSKPDRPNGARWQQGEWIDF